MQSEEFRDALETLIRMSRQERVAIMCAEAVPWRCHRSLVADALTVRGIAVVEILSESSYRMHKLTPFARIEQNAHYITRSGKLPYLCSSCSLTS